MYSAIIFDIDGTLIDSSAGIIASVGKVISEFNLKKLSDKDLRNFIRVSPIQQAFMDFCHVDADTAQRCSVEYRKNYLDGDLYKSVIYNGVKSLLNYLKSQNCKLGIASYKRQDTLEKILEYFELSEYMSSICGAGVENTFTKNDILEHCIKNLQVKPSETVFIGDSISDCVAAKYVGCDFIGVTYGFGFKCRDELVKKYFPVLCAESVYDIIEFFKKN